MFHRPWVEEEINNIFLKRFQCFYFDKLLIKFKLVVIKSQQTNWPIKFSLFIRDLWGTSLSINYSLHDKHRWLTLHNYCYRLSLYNRAWENNRISIEYTLLPPKFAPFIFRSLYISLPLYFAPFIFRFIFRSPSVKLTSINFLPPPPPSWCKISLPLIFAPLIDLKEIFEELCIVTRPKICCHLQTRHLTSYPKCGWPKFH